MVRKLSVRKIAVLLLMSLALQICIPAAAAEFYTQADLDDFDITVGLLEAVGVLESGEEYDMASTVKKGKLMQSALRLFMGGNATINAENYLGYVASLGADPGEVSLNAENDATQYYALRSLLYGLGYSRLVNEMGGEQMTAQRIGLLDGVDYQENQMITFGQLIKMYENALDVTILQFIESDGVVRTINSTGTLLETVLKLERKRGVITATEWTPLFGEDTAPKGGLVIEDVIYTAKKSYKEYLGYEVEFYVSIGKNEIVYLSVPQDLNTVLTLSSDTLIGYENNTYEWNDGARVRSAKIASPFYVIYNGFAASDLSKWEMCPEYGRVTLIDNDRNGQYDVVIIEDYTIAKITSLNTDTEMLYADTNDGVISINLHEYDCYEVGARSGSSLKLSSLKANDFVLIMQSRNMNYAYIGLLSSIVNGTVDEITKAADGKPDQISIGGESYPVSEKYYGGEVKLGSNCSVYLDNGQIVAVGAPADGNGIQYGYLAKGALVQESFKSYLKLKIFSESGQMFTVDTAERVVANRVVYKDAKKDSLYALISDEKGKFCPQLVKFSLNDSGQLDYLDTAYNYSDTYKTDKPSPEESEDSFRMLYSSLKGGTSVTRYSVGTFSGKFIAGTGCVMFQVPSEPDTADDSDYFVTTGGGDITYEKTFSVEAFSNDASDIYANAMVVYNAGVRTTLTYPGLITEIRTELDKDGCQVQRINLVGPPGVSMDFYNYDYTEDIPTYNNANGPTHDYEVGDIVNCSFKGDRVVGLTMIYNRSDDFLAPMPSNYSYGVGQYYIMGYGYEKEGNAFRLTKEDPAVTQPDMLTKELYQTGTGFNVRYVSKGKDGSIKIESGSVDDIVDYRSDPVNYTRRCFAVMHTGFAWLLVIYEN